MMHGQAEIKLGLNILSFIDLRNFHTCILHYWIDDDGWKISYVVVQIIVVVIQMSYR